MVIWRGILKVASGKREAYLNELKKADFIGEFVKQPGNLFYSIGASLTNPDEVLVIDGWKDRETFEAHDSSEKVDEWREIYARYVIDCMSELYEFSPEGEVQ